MKKKMMNDERTSFYVIQELMLPMHFNRQPTTSCVKSEGNENFCVRKIENNSLKASQE